MKHDKWRNEWIIKKKKHKKQYINKMAKYILSQTQKV